MNILLTGAYKYAEEQIKMISDMGFSVDFLGQEKDRIENPQKYDAVVCNGLFLYHNIEDFKNLKFIQLTSAGLDRVPLEYINNHNITIKNARGVYSIPIAEYTVLKILELYKNSRVFYERQKAHEWIKERNLLELYGKKATIIGCGSIGVEIAKRLKAFGVSVYGVDNYVKESEWFLEIANTDELYSATKDCDIVISSLPHTNETDKIFNKRFFENMKNDAIFVNISRGGVVDENDLINALKNKEIAGAVLDVFLNEPLADDSELWGMDNVIVTPHNSFVGEGNVKRMFDVIYNNLKDWRD